MLDQLQWDDLMITDSCQAVIASKGKISVKEREPIAES